MNGPRLQWLGNLTKKKNIRSATGKFSTTEGTPYIDKRLLHVWEARRQLSKRWKRQRRNEKLRKHITEFSAKAAVYASEMAKVDWLELCDGVSGRRSLKQISNLLRRLIYPTKGKSEARREITRTFNTYKGTHQQLLGSLGTLPLMQ